MTGAHPRLRSHSRRRKSGRVVTYYFLDMRGEGKPDEPLGTDYEKALVRYREIVEHAPRIAGTLQEAFEGWRKEVLPGHKPVTRLGYTKNLKQIEPVFGPATWDRVGMPQLKGYLKKRTGKVQANRELALLSVVWNWAVMEGMTTLPYPAAGLKRARWKNREGSRKLPERALEAWPAIYEAGDQVLRDAMDIASATGLRLTDARSVPLPPGDVLRLPAASKTGKPIEFDIAGSVLAPIVERRRTYKATHLALLSTPTRAVSASMLRARWDLARIAAVEARPELADAIRALWLRDARKLAADAAPSLTAAAEMLQHDDERLTRRHYRGAAARLKPVR